MPTNANAYNTRLTDETLEQRFRQTFRSQGGAELVDDLYASGVIVPVVDFTAAAEGSALRDDLQKAWDITAGSDTINDGSETIISNAGFWKIQLVVNAEASVSGLALLAKASIDSGVANRPFWQLNNSNTTVDYGVFVSVDELIVYLRANDDVIIQSNSAKCTINATWRQIADVNGNLVQPSGFSFS